MFWIGLQLKYYCSLQYKAYSILGQNPVRQKFHILPIAYGRLHLSESFFQSVSQAVNFFEWHVAQDPYLLPLNRYPPNYNKLLPLRLYNQLCHSVSKLPDNMIWL